MANSTLDPDREKHAPTPQRHGTAQLGPSGTSDSGSDLQGPGLALDAGLDLETGTTSDPERSGGAGHDVGDANLDGDSDEAGTGERATAGRDDEAGAARDIAPDRIIGSELPMPSDALDRIDVNDAAAGDESDEPSEGERAHRP